MGLPPYGPEPYASANSATPALQVLANVRLLILSQRVRVGKNKFVTYAVPVHFDERTPMFPKTTEAAEQHRRRLFPGRQPALGRNDPEYVEITENFAFDEAIAAVNLPDRTRSISALASLVGTQSVDAFRAMASGGLQLGVTPVELKELVYQATPYLGLGRTLPSISAVNDILKHHGVDLPLEPRSTPTRETRLEAGNAVQVEIFGEGMRESWKNAPEETRHIDEWLAANCFGDYYTRKGLSLADRELITFILLISQGGCEPQAIAHAKGNFAVGNDRAFLIRAVSICVPYIGYPRVLNAITCIKKASEEE